FHKNPIAYHQSYSNQLFKLVRSEAIKLRLVKLGCGGETTRSFIKGVRHCPFPEGSQLAQAVKFLESNPGQVEFITIDLGGNDIIGACLNFRTAALKLNCVKAVMPTIQANLTTILQTLETAAPGVPIYGMTFYNPLLGLWVLGWGGGPGDPSLAQANAKSWAVFNAGLVAAYEANGVTVADVAGAFAISDFSDLVPLKGAGMVPLNVANDCNWTWNCTTPPLGWDIHPNNKGYGVIAQAFADVVTL
ncbi:MAG TPA: SGNH/GDSL hydrolase family protein, partial [Actinomycetes bacterium]|nr:SGNH/GDSL hydrolase family protein [Actinomycetes bacterium]